MCKKLVILLVVFMASICQAEMAIWGLTEIDSLPLDIEQSKAVSIRVGYCKDKLEGGLTSKWHPKSNAPQVWGFYGIYHFDKVVEIPNPINIFNALPETLTMRPYIGGEVGVNLDNDSGFATLIAGAQIQKILYLEYQFQTIDGVLERYGNDEHRVAFGLRYEF